MSFKKTFVASILAISLSVPFIAQANDLVITNHTKRDSTSIINRGACSTILGETGITRAGKTNVVPQGKVRFACILNSANCRADVFMTANCTGPVIATVIFDTKAGIKSVQMFDPSYVITGSGFNISLAGGPAA